MDYLHHDLDLGSDDVVEVTLDHPANVILLDHANFLAYRNRQPYTYFGGHVTRSPFRIQAPHSGKWHLVVDMGGGPGRVRASAKVISPSTAA